MFEAIMAILNGIISGEANDDYYAELEKIKAGQTLASEYLEAQSVYESLANQGLPYYEQQKAEIDTSIPTTLNQARDYLNGGGMVDALKSIYSNTQQQKRQLDVANAQQRIANQQAYGQFLGGVKAPAQQHVSDVKTELALQQAEAQITGTKDKLAFANYGASGLDPNNILNLLGSGDLSKIISLLLAKKKQDFSMDELNPYYSLPKTADFGFEIPNF